MASFWFVGAHLPAYNILLGAGDIRRPAAAVLLATTAALVMKIAIAQDAGLMGVALANLVCLLPVIGIYLPYCACRLARMSLADLYRQAYLPPILGLRPWRRSDGSPCTIGLRTVCSSLWPTSGAS